VYSARIILDSKNLHNNVRITTFELTYPRIIHGEFMTHRVFSRNAASSRAIPVNKMLEQVKNDPFIPIYWGKNQPGMKARQEIAPKNQEEAREIWLEARDAAVNAAEKLIELEVHKQTANRLLEPFSWITVLLTTTELANFFKLRDHQDAQPEFKKIAKMTRDIYMNNLYPEQRQDKELECLTSRWHLPLVDGYDYNELVAAGYPEKDIVKICIGRCARVSYLTHEGIRDPQKDIELFDSLYKEYHDSPLEHAALAKESLNTDFFANFRGWQSYRNLIGR
jgi:thymidylate synthase ThyX